MSLRLAALVKQVPYAEDLRLGSDGRLVRGDSALEMSAYCRRAVSKAVELAASAPGSSVTVVTMGPPAAVDVLREAVAWGLDRAVAIRGILVTDPALAGSDTIASARALSAVLEREGPFDVIFAGRNSLDADTGQVPPQVAAILDLPFATGVKQLTIEEGTLRLGCEHDDSWLDVEVSMPAVISCAERLCEPTKVPPAGRQAVPAHLVTSVGAADLGPGPWGLAASRTEVGACRTIAVDRARHREPDAPVSVQVDSAVRLLLDSGALARGMVPQAPVVPPTGGPGQVVVVVAEPEQDALAQDLCGLAARLAAAVGGSTILVAPHGIDAAQAGAWGADRIVGVHGAEAEEDVARAVTDWAASACPWAILVGSTAYGREVASRIAVALDAGLTGDAVEVDVVDARLVAWKPAFGGAVVAAITASSSVQLVTVRPGVVAKSRPRNQVAEIEHVDVEPRGRVRVLRRRREDALHDLGEAEVVIGVGKGVAPDDVQALDELRELLGAELGCTRKMTDAGWMPHARQIGITGRAIAPRLYVAIGASGKFNHLSGVRAAGTIVAINPDPDAPIWEFCDVGIVGRWQECLPLLTNALRDVLAPV